MRRWICFCSSLLAMYSSDAMALNASSLTETRSARVSSSYQVQSLNDALAKCVADSSYYQQEIADVARLYKHANREIWRLKAKLARIEH